eukprot:200458_1
MRGKRRGTPAASRQELQNLRNQTFGIKYVPKPDPPTFVEKPWNSWTFNRTYVTSAGSESVPITVADVITQISTKLSVSADRLVVKIQRAAVWCTAASTLLLPDISVSFYEVSEKTVAPQMARSEQRDLGTLNRPAKCGYIYPMADQKEIIYKAEDQLLVLNAVADTSGSLVTCRVHVLWNVQSVV